MSYQTFERLIMFLPQLCGKRLTPDTKAFLEEQYETYMQLKHQV